MAPGRSTCVLGFHGGYVRTIVQQFPQTSFHPGLIPYQSEDLRPDQAGSRLGPSFLFRRGDHVIHPQWGHGRVLNAGSPPDVTVRFHEMEATLPGDSLRRLLPRSVVAQVIREFNPNVSA